MFLEECRHLEFRTAKVLKGKRLMNHMIGSADVTDKQFCGALCFMEPNCVSYNLMEKSGTGKHKCELNNATHEGHEEDLEENPDYVYRGAKVRASQITENNCKFEEPTTLWKRQEDYLNSSLR